MVDTVEHSTLDEQELHQIYRKYYADEAARLADGTLTADDVKKLFYQESDDSIWLLTGIGPNTWLTFCTDIGDVWDDLLINSGVFEFAGVGDPTLSNWQPGGAGTTFKVYKFQKNDEVFFSCQFPHTYKEGSDIYPHLHWTPADRGVAENGNLVGWKLDYTWCNIDGTFVSSGTIDLQDACDGTNHKHQVAIGAAITGTGKKISSMVMCRLYREDTGADDTWVGTIAAESPAILQFDFHHLIDADGSRQEWVK